MKLVSLWYLSTICFLPQRTVLHKAVSRGQSSLMRHLLGHGADVNAQDLDEVEWLDLVSTCYHGLFIVSRFFKCCQDTPLHLAVEERNEDVVKLLVDGGADMNAKNKNWVRST